MDKLKIISSWHNRTWISGLALKVLVKWVACSVRSWALVILKATLTYNDVAFSCALECSQVSRDTTMTTTTRGTRGFIYALAYIYVSSYNTWPIKPIKKGVRLTLDYIIIIIGSKIMFGYLESWCVDANVACSRLNEIIPTKMDWSRWNGQYDTLIVIYRF